MNKKPPVGLRPAFIVNQERIEEIKEAIIRYIDAKIPIPKEWIEEYNNLAGVKGPLWGVDTFIAARYHNESEKDFIERYNHRIDEINSHLIEDCNKLYYLIDLRR